jgi:superfamily II DNA/RNA helicase
MAAFKAGKKDILIATDVAARGIDVNDVTHVINHTIPEDHDTYLHRAGRTGRAGKTGIAVTFVDWDDMHKWSLINRALEMGIPEPVETYSSSPHLFSDLDIPEGTKGRLPGSVPRAREAAPAAQGGRPPRTSSGDGNRPPRQRSSHGTDAVRSSAEGGGTHDGASPTRRRRTRTRHGGSGAAGSTPPPA